MFKISVSNIHGGSWTSTKNTQLEADQWIEKHKKNGTFGKEERKVRQDTKPKDLEYEEVAKFKLDKNTYELILDEDGMPVEEGVEYIVTYPCEYKIEIEEMVTELSREDYTKKLLDCRQRILDRTDFTQIPDCQFSPEIRKMFREYRQQLRDMTKHYNEKTVVNFKLKDFHEWYRKKYIEVSNKILKQTENLNEQIKDILK